MKLNTIKHLSIGSTIEIISSPNKSLEGIKGKIIDETKHILTVQTKDSIKKIMKSHLKNGKTKLQ